MPRSPRYLPAKGSAGGTAEKRVPNGDMIQRRFYGPDDRAELNVDYGHDHTGVGDLMRMIGTGQKRHLDSRHEH